MIISPPLLKTPQGNQSDEDWLKGLMPFESKGNYPISSLLAWHGGQHIEHTDTGPRGEPVRAIADGKVMFARKPSPLTGANAKPDLAINGGSSDGCVVIKHSTEIGEGGDGKVEYYSIYMHLKQVFVQKNQPVYRKDELGSVGQCNGNNAMHMEIICDDANLKKLVGREEGDLDLSKDGRMDVVYGNMHFYLPAGATFYAAQPSATASSGVGAPAYTSAVDLFITMRFDKGNSLISTRQENTESAGEYLCVGDEIKEVDYEYDLYKKASTLGEANHIAPSAVYELLRFGRVIHVSNEITIESGTVPHWRKVNYPAGQGWVNLNATSIKKYSDADFPHWMGWSLIADDATPDSQCNSPVLLGWLDSDGDKKYTSRELVQALGLDKIKERLSRSICKFPTEWEVATLNTRYEWIKTKSDLLEIPLDTDQYENFIKITTALCFWAEADLGIAADHWHFHPKEFIRQFRKCEWLSKNELERIYPDSKYATSALSVIGKTPQSIRNEHLNNVNYVMRKYLINTPSRKSHFLGQGAVESAHLSQMVEGSANFTRNPRHPSFQSEINGYYMPTDRGNYLFYLEDKLGNIEAGDGPKFRGRGMKQLTGREHYSKYWVYRGWLNRESFSARWWGPARPAVAPAILEPQRLSINSFNGIDAGGWYWHAGSASNSFRSINSIIINTIISRSTVFSVAKAINGINSRTHEPNGLNERLSETIFVSKLLMDEI
ncbi:MAG: M23 family metallopeptidase [Burkholderiales bacterium]|nr:M23 family metallopeptidase [Burkholderiales bacterium]